MSKIIKKHISTITKTPVHWRTSRNKVAFIPQAYSHYLSPLQKGESLYSFISRNSANCTSPASLHHQWWHNPFRLPSLFAEGIKCTQQLKFASIPQKEKKYEYNEKDSRSNDMIRASKDALFLSLCVCLSLRCVVYMILCFSLCVSVSVSFSVYLCPFHTLKK